jgi:tetratricopeptide (TPR) repeat protein
MSGTDMTYRTHLLRCLDWSAIILLGLAIAFAIRAQGPDPAEADYARGVSLQQNGDLAGARRAYEAALKTSPHRVDVLSNLGLVYGQLEETDLAVSTFRKALTIEPNQPIVRFNLSLTYMQAQQFENARHELDSMLRTQPENTTARYLLGLAKLKTGDLNGGIADLEKVRTAQQQNIELACTLTSANIKAKRLDAARELVETTLANADIAEAHFLSGSYYLATGDYRSSLKELQRAYELNPSLPELESSLADAYALTGNQDVAAQMFEKDVREHPNDYTANTFLGWLYLEAHDIEKAAVYLDRAHHIRPGDPDLLFQLARLARLQEKQQEAAALLERVIAAKPQYVPAHVLLAQAYMKLKRVADASRERSIVRQLNTEEQERQVAPQSR